MIRGLKTVVLFCADTDASRVWYERAGFTYTHGERGRHWFLAGETEVMLHPSDVGAAIAGPELRLAVDDVEGHFRQALSADLVPLDELSPGTLLTAPVQRPWGERDFELEDPDGYLWAFVQE